MSGWYHVNLKLKLVQLKGCSPTSPTPRGKMFEFEARIKVLTRLLTATSPLCLSHCSHLEQSLTTLALQHTRCISDLWFLVVGGFREVRQWILTTMLILTRKGDALSWVGFQIVTRSSTLDFPHWRNSAQFMEYWSQLDWAWFKVALKVL